MAMILDRKASFLARSKRPAVLVALAPLLAIAAGCAKPYSAHDHLSLSSDRPGERLVVKNSVPLDQCPV